MVCSIKPLLSLLTFFSVTLLRLSCGRAVSRPIVKLKIIDVDATVSLSEAHNAPRTLIDVDADN